MRRNFQEHHWIWIGSGVALIVLVVVALILFDYPSDDEEAQQKADELATALELAGIYVPDQDTLMGWFSNDGGAVCQAASDLTLAQLNQQIGNGAAQAGIRERARARADRVIDTSGPMKEVQAAVEEALASALAGKLDILPFGSVQP